MHQSKPGKRRHVFAAAVLATLLASTVVVVAPSAPALAAGAAQTPSSITESAPTYAQYGETFYVYTQVTGASGVPTGNVSLFYCGQLLAPADCTDGSPAGLEYLDSDGRARFTFTPPSPGLYCLRAIYEGDNLNTGSTVDGACLLVDRADQNISFAPIPDGRIDDTAAMSASGGSSGNPITFSTQTPGVCTVTGTTVTMVAAGTCTVAADQVGNIDYAAAPTATQSFYVRRVASDVAVQLPSGSTVFGQGFTASASISADRGTPVGAVQFGIDGTDVGNPVPVVAGRATSAALYQPVGAHAVTAVYEPADPLNWAPAVGSGNLVIDQAATTSTIQVLPHRVVVRVAPVAPGAGRPTGVVTVALDGATVGTASLAHGRADLVYTATSTSSHGVSATYPGDTSFTGSATSTARRNPTIVAKVTSSTKPTKFGWYKNPVTVKFTCTPHGAPLVKACPSPVTRTSSRAARAITRTAKATDGGAATAIATFSLDRIKPTVKIAGIKDGGRYSGDAPTPRCVGTDALSGLASCVVLQSALADGTVRYSAVATDKAGNSRTLTGSYRMNPPSHRQRRLETATPHPSPGG